MIDGRLLRRPVGAARELLGRPITPAEATGRLLEAPRDVARFVLSMVGDQNDKHKITDEEPEDGAMIIETEARLKFLEKEQKKVTITTYSGLSYNSIEDYEENNPVQGGLSKQV